MRGGFEEYVRARGEALCRFAFLLCGDRHLGEDLVQEVLVKAYRRWPKIEMDQPDHYFRTSLVRSHVSWLRRRSSSEMPAEIPDDRPVHGDYADQQATRDDLWGRLDALTRAQRAVLVLRYYEDLDDRQIAEVLRCSASTIRVHAARGLSRLRATVPPPAASSLGVASVGAPSEDPSTTPGATL